MNLADLRTCQNAALTVTAVAGLLHLDERTVRRACEDGDLPRLKVGRRLLIPREPLLALLTTPLHNGAELYQSSATAATDQDFGGPGNAKSTAHQLRSA